MQCEGLLPAPLLVRAALVWCFQRSDEVKNSVGTAPLHEEQQHNQAQGIYGRLHAHNHNNHHHRNNTKYQNFPENHRYPYIFHNQNNPISGFCVGSPSRE